MKTGRNQPCPCGSGKKYKKCCLNKAKPPLDLLWRRLGNAHDRLIDKLLTFADRFLGELAMALAMGDFMLWPETDLPKDPADEHVQLFTPWFVFNWVYDPDYSDIGPNMPTHQTVAQIYAREQSLDLDELERRLIDAAVNQPYSFLEVVSCNPGQGFRLKDILQGVETDVMEKKGSENARPGDILLGRIVQVDYVAMLVGCSSILIPPSRKPAIIDLRNYLLQENRYITADVLNEYDTEIRELYFHIYKAQLQPPKICNTDGDPLMFHTLHYEIDDPETAFRRLSDLSATEDPQTLRNEATLDAQGMVLKAEIPWSRKGHKASSALDNTILGHIVIDHRKLSVEVNSEARAKTIRQEIKARLGGQARYKKTKIQSPETMLSKGQNAQAKEIDQNELMQIPEVQERLAKVLTAHWEGWIDQKLPALGGQTPRKAIKTPDGRESVEALLLDAERQAARDEQMAPIGLTAIEDVRRQLRLDKAPAAKAQTIDKQKIKASLLEIKNKIENFGQARLNELYTGLALKLCDRIARTRRLTIERGRTEIWAAAVIHVIARLNFLFDPENEIYITTDEMGAFFGTKKTTVSNKAGFIQEACNIYFGDKEFSAPEIYELFRLYETEDGFLVPGFMTDFPDDMDLTGFKSPWDKKRRPDDVKLPQGEKAIGEKSSHGTDKKKETDSRQIKLFDDS
ncbi:MAG: SEC-C domain-containing protein [Desulfobacterales bacterium]|uniref:SEC-C domain-containing protein n=1 Tax=Candidatus Desulfatibia profunda TaxID=2841695 RepID=A0A8J6TK83_9BACT|nr:SEC-C domain-containing protein [Candidatus Desulfatibia profunda]MBL7178771.1 SEC-C domain-containing protein [Desulfobacterales bacterium]